MKRILLLLAVFGLGLPLLAQEAPAAPEAPPKATTRQYVWKTAGPGEMEQEKNIEIRRMRHGGPELGKWWKNSKIAADLKLTEAQISQIEQTFLDHRLKLIDLRADLERQEVKLQPLVEADQPDEAKVGAQIDLVLAARGRLEKANTMMMLAIRRVLSVEQWKKLQSIKQERDHVFTLRTPGPPHMPHPPMAPMPPAMEIEEDEL